MKVMLYPFCSQQCKERAKFLLASDGAVKQFRFMASELLKLGHDAGLALPPHRQCIDDPSLVCEQFRSLYEWTLDNFERRYQWNTTWLKRLLDGVDLLVTTHETLAVPAKALFPKLKVATECANFGVAGETRKLMELALASSDLEWASYKATPRCCVWPFSYDSDLVASAPYTPRDIDVLFNARCSVTNYSHHVEFVAAVRDAGYRVLMPDVTGYAKVAEQCPTSWLPDVRLERSEYVAALRRAKVVVNLMDYGPPSHSLVEAVVVGCVPVTLRTAATVELLGYDWPYFCSLDSVSKTIRQALQYRWWPPQLYNDVMQRVAERSYSASWKQAWSDLCRFLQ